MGLNLDRPDVSCIVIFLDEERFIAEAVDSVLAQSGPSWELILVDDGSSDRSRAIAESYVARDPDRIRVMAHAGGANCGMSASRNLGAASARGRYVAFLDADDVWMPHKLRDQVALLDARPDVGVLYGRTLIWHSWSTVSPRALDHFTPLGVVPGSVLEPPSLAVRTIENRYQTPTTCNAMVRREAFDRAGGFEDRFRGMFEDQAFFAKVGLHERVLVASNCWAKYRQHPRSHSAVSAQDAASVRDARRAWLDWFEAWLVEQKAAEPEVWHALHRARRETRWPAIRRWRGRFERLQRRLVEGRV